MNSAAQWSVKKWQRLTHAAVVIAGVSLISLVFVLAQSIPSTDARLIGTWQSDGDRTVAGMLESRAVDEKQEAALRNLFGKMRVTYTSTAYTSELGGTIETSRHEVLGKDKHSVVIREIDREPSLMDELELSEFMVVHFDGPDSYWFYTQVGGVQEHFKRIR